MATAHIEAAENDFAKTVLFPGDPLRAQFIAKNYLKEARCVNKVRNILAFTGFYQGKKVSVMGSGMGIPSVSIYAYELYSFYGVENIVRIGSCGALTKKLHLKDLILAMGACTDSQVNRRRFDGYDFAATADYDLLEKAVELARKQKLNFSVGKVLTTDLFYHADTESLFKTTQKMGVLGIEMETAGLYGVATSLGKKALAILSVSDHLLVQEELDSKQREQGLTTMIEIALSLGAHFD